MNAFIVRADARHLPLRDESVDCIVTSPPYWRLRNYGFIGQIGLESSPEGYVAQIVAAMEETRRALRPKGTAWIVIGDSYAGSGHKAKNLIGIPWRVVFALQAAGWWLRSDIVWSKPNPMPESVKDRPTRSHEYVFLLSKSERYWYDAEAIREDFAEGTYLRLNQRTFSNQLGGPKDYGKNGRGLHSARRALENLHRKFEGTGFPFVSNGDPPHRGLEGAREDWRERNRGFDTREDTPGQRPRRSKTAECPRQASKPGEPNAFHENGRNARTVWTIATQPYSGAHFATFPEELARRCIIAGCPPGGTVLDPFAGSGTVGKIAIEHGRNAVLCDLASHDLQAARIRNVQRPLLTNP